MKKLTAKHPFPLFPVCLALFFIFSGLIRGIETDFGQILIHNIICESYEGFPYNGRLYRPLTAQSLDQRPGILLIYDSPVSKTSYDPLSMVLVKNGYAVLTIEKMGQGMTKEDPAFITETHIDSGFDYLVTRSFTDHGKIGLLSIGDNEAAIGDSEHIGDFNAVLQTSALAFPESIAKYFRETIPVENIPQKSCFSGILLHLLKLLAFASLLFALGLIRTRIPPVCIQLPLGLGLIALLSSKWTDINIGLPFFDLTLPDKGSWLLFGVLLAGSAFLFSLPKAGKTVPAAVAVLCAVLGLIAGKSTSIIPAGIILGALFFLFDSITEKTENVSQWARLFPCALILALFLNNLHIL